ncbi:MAG TPA: hypothetical protein VI911_00970 [Patescibacteria group bacterium]|nr:hypothetical protein [Patescibacteria group bacterium]
MTTFKDIKLKVLPLPSFFYFYRRLLGEEITLTECVENYSGYVHEIRPMVGRDGWYYDRVNNFAWFEVDKRAFVDLTPESFVYELKMLNHIPLPAKVKRAITVLKNYNACPADLKELIYTDECFLMGQQAYRSATLARLRVRRRFRK